MHPNSIRFNQNMSFLHSTYNRDLNIVENTNKNYKHKYKGQMGCAPQINPTCKDWNGIAQVATIYWNLLASSMQPRSNANLFHSFITASSPIVKGWPIETLPEMDVQLKKRFFADLSPSLPSPFWLLFNWDDTRFCFAELMISKTPLVGLQPTTVQ